MNNCGTCRFAGRWTEEWLRRCKRHAPVFIGDRPLGVFPVVSSDTWCGDYEPREEPSTQKMKPVSEPRIGHKGL